MPRKNVRKITWLLPKIIVCLFLVQTIGIDSNARPLNKQNIEETTPANKPINNKLDTLAEKLLNLLKNKGRLKEALNVAQALLKETERQYGRKTREAMAIHSTLGDIYFELGEYSQAAIYYRNALDIYNIKGNRENTYKAKLLNKLGLSYGEQRVYHKAEISYLEALKIYEKDFREIHPEAASVLTNLAILKASLGQYETAEELAKHSLSIRSELFGSNHQDTASSLETLAFIYNQQSKLTQSEELYKQSLKIKTFLFGINHPETAKVLGNLGMNFFRQGLFSKAEEYTSNALNISEVQLGPNHKQTIRNKNNLGLIYLEINLYGRAKELFLDVRDAYAKKYGNDHPMIAASIANLAEIESRLGMHREAINLNKEALRIEENLLGKEHINIALILNNLAMSHSLLGENNEATSLLKRSLHIYRETLGEDHPDTGRAYNNLATLYHSQGMHKEAEKYYQVALTIFEKTLGKEHPYPSTTLGNLAALYIDQNLYAKAKEPLQQSFTRKNKFARRELPFLGKNERLLLTKEMNAVAREIFYASTQDKELSELALFTRLNQQGLLASIEKRQNEILSLDKNNQEYVSELQGIIEEISAFSLHKNRRIALASRQSSLEKEIYRSLSYQMPPVIETEQIFNSLPSDGVLIEFQQFLHHEGKRHEGKRVGEQRYLALVAKPNQSISVIDLGNAANIDNAINKAVESIEKRWSDSPQLIEEVSRLVIQPIFKTIQQSKIWFISPDGEINNLPFAVIPSTNKSKEYLTDEFNIHLVTTGRDLVDLKNKGYQSNHNSLIIADPLFNYVEEQHSLASPSKNYIDRKNQQPIFNEDKSRWNPLPATEKEGKAIQKLIGGTLLMRQQASVDAIKNRPAPIILHLATHGFFLSNNIEKNSYQPTNSEEDANAERLKRNHSLEDISPLLRSGVVLAGANNSNQISNNDGYLTALELAQMNLTGTELVVISACDSGKGHVQVGEGIYGLKRAISVAGAKSSLLSLWKVDDEATAAFMISFYKRLKAGMGRGDALSATQKEFREHENEDWRDPYVWAAFQLSGDWGPIEGL